VFVVIPFAAYFAYWLTTGGNPRLLSDNARMGGFFGLVFAGMLFAPWIALAAMLRQREAMARTQALAFDLERSELARQALDARMQLLQAQVQPHFLFNTLANVRALVDSGSAQASQVLGSLIAYLRAAVPRLNDSHSSLAQELDLVRAYLELMHMRMPDRLQFSVQCDAAAQSLRFPPLALLTLVENAVRHGIDPSVDGGRIDVDVRVIEGRCQASVSDSGVGLQAAGDSNGTGLANLRERLKLIYAGDARLSVVSLATRGVRATLDFPVPTSAA
jgi:LytS/YehU family sensor histidine kinase